MHEFKKECCAKLATLVTKIQDRSPLKYSFVRKLASLDPGLIVVELDPAVKMFKQVLKKLVDTKWRKTEQADDILTQYKTFVSEMKQFTMKHLLVSSSGRTDWMLSSVVY